MDLGLKGRTALVTGASQGIGRAVSLRYAAEGVRVVLCARREAPLQELAAAIKADGGTAIAVPCDVTDPDAPARVLEAAAESFGLVDVLVNNAGIATPAKLLATTEADWQAGMDLNFLSAVRFTRACLPAMVDAGRGSIVHVSSTTAKIADPYYAIYGAAKAALISFSKTVSISFATDGIRSNCVLPGITRSEMVEANFASAREATGATPEEVMERTLKKARIPVGRIAEPEEIADAIVFLTSPNADWITGIAMPLDGGTIPVAS